MWNIIATSNPNLPLPQLSQKSIAHIVENNGKLGNFDVEIKENLAEIILTK